MRHYGGVTSMLHEKGWYLLCLRNCLKNMVLEK